MILILTIKKLRIQPVYIKFCRELDKNKGGKFWGNKRKSLLLGYNTTEEIPIMCLFLTELILQDDF